MTNHVDNYEDGDTRVDSKGRERPFDYNFNLVGCERLIDGLALPSARRQKGRDVLTRLLANLALGTDSSRSTRLFYSRANDEYPRHRHHAPVSFSRRTVTRAVQDLLDQKLIEERRTKPSSNATLRSAIWATPDLLQALSCIKAEHIVYALTNPIILRDGEKQLVRYDDTCETRSMRRQVREQNEALASADIKLDAACWETTRLGLRRRPDGEIINPHKRQLYRVFNNGHWHSGGRYYGAFWQGLAKEDRKLLERSTAARASSTTSRLAI